MEIKTIIGKDLDANTYILLKDKEAIIIDSDAELDDVKKFIGDNKVLGVLLTHAHFDHALHCKQYAKEFNCPIFLHENGKEILKDPEKNYGKTYFINDFSDFKFLNEKSGDFTLGHFKIEYYSTPGHSPCSVCYKIGDCLFAGDTLFENGIGRIDLIGSSKKDMIESLHLLQGLEFADVFSGHGAKSDYIRQKRNISIYLKFLSR